MFIYILQIVAHILLSSEPALSRITEHVPFIYLYTFTYQARPINHINQASRNRHWAQIKMVALQQKKISPFSNGDTVEFEINSKPSSRFPFPSRLAPTQLSLSNQKLVQVKHLIKNQIVAV